MTPIPPGRGRWRLTVHHRVFGPGPYYPSATGVAELVDARSRRLEANWCQPAQLTFTLDGRGPSAAAISELAQDVIAWRWDDQAGQDVPMFRGPITQSEDQLADAHVVTFTCHDYLAMLQRRILTGPTPLNYTQTEQDTIVGNLLNLASHPLASSGADAFYPGSSLPLARALVNPDGTTRATGSGQLRDRSYLGGSLISDLVDQLAKVINGFDYDVLPRSDLNGTDQLRLFYPQQGVTRTAPAMVYGSTVATVTRAVNSTDYGNYWRVIGNNGSSDQNAAQMWAEAWNSDANNVGVLPVGLWMDQDNASDVNIQSTLNEKAQGDLALSGALIPAYTLGLRPGAYALGSPNMGDTVPLIIQSGRLNVNTTVRVMGLVWDISDDGAEDVEVTVVRPAVTLAQTLTDAHKDVNALARR